jgi:enamine deaminase RidA (YjgF/YER057c/UK114 family)
MTRRLITTGSSFEEAFAYSRAVVQGEWCFVSGTTGYDYATMTIPADAPGQARNTFRTIESALTEAGFALADIVRLQFTVTDPAHMDAVAPVLREFMGDVRPAATAVVCDLIRPEVLIEIEATALRRGG